MIDDPMLGSYKQPSKTELLVTLILFGFIVLLVMFYFQRM
jgi:hypothetical protein